MASLLRSLCYQWGFIVGAGLLASCAEPSESTRAPQPAAPPALAVVSITHYYAYLLASGARLATPASRRYAGTAAIAATDTSFSLVLPPCDVVALLTKQQRLLEVDILPHPAPEDPNRMALAVVQPAAHLVRLGELRRIFGAGARLPPPLHVLPHYRFTYRPVPSSHSVTIEAFMAAPYYVDSARAQHLLLYLTPPQ